MDAHQKQERPQGHDKKGAGCVIIAVVGVLVAVVVVVGGAFIMYNWTRKAAAVDRAETIHAGTLLKASEAALAASGEDSGMVTLTAESIGTISATGFGDELTREHFVAMVMDDHATDLMRKQFAEKANGMRVRWLLRVDDVSAPDSTGAIKASMSMPYRIIRGSGWSGSSVSVRAEFGPDAMNELVKIRRGQWVALEGELRLEGARDARILAARVVE